MNRFLFIIAALLFASLSSAETVVAESPKSNSGPKIARKKTLAYSQQIDKLINRHLKADGQRRNPPINDATFARRAYLTVIGRIPNIDEAENFLKSNASQKRSDTIDELLDSYGYVSHQFNFLADLLRVKSNLTNNTPGDPYIRYIKDALEEDKPYDELVYELLSADGAIFEEDNGAVGYYLRDRNMPEDNMSNSVRIFLGTRLECAQCHDHPFDKWTQREYFEMVAFTGGMRYQVDDQNGNYGQRMRQLAKTFEKDGKPIDYEILNNVRRAYQRATAGISGSGTGLTRLPENYEGSDGNANDIVTAKTMFDGKAILDVEIPQQKSGNKKKAKKRKQSNIRNAKPIGSREAYAKWMTEADNPRFAKVIANRLWKQAFGIGLIEPVDVIEDTTVASNPELLDYLTEVMIEVDFDMKEFLRIVYNTQAWQAEVTKADITEPHEYGFPGPVLRRMSAEQLWDSMIGLSVDEVDQRYDEGENKRYAIDGKNPYAYYQMIKSEPIEDIFEKAVSSQQKNKGKKKGNSGKNAEARVLKQKLKQQLRELGNQIKKAQKAGDWKRARKLMVERTEIVSENRVSIPNSQYRRASEIRSPAPPKHFLREFGQSDRETIENANTEPAVTQVLRLMNGFVDDKIAKDINSVLTRNALYADNAREAIDRVYLTMLTRHATLAEKQLWSADFANDKKAAFTDLVWTLINSNEFMFVR